MAENMSDRRIALVTGANTGIGFEVVRALAEQGLTVYLGSRDDARGRAAAASLAASGDVRFVRLDLQDPETLTDALAVIEQMHGRLDILINNAGVALPGSVLTVDPQVVQDSFAVNLHGPMRLAQLAVPLLRKGRQARVVNVSSTSGTFGYIGRTEPAYTPYSYVVAKAALNAATLALAVALKPDGIKVNAACPRLVNTRLSHHMGDRGPAQGATIIVDLATLDEDGPTGGFFDENGPKDW